MGWRHRQEMLGGKRDRWILHRLGSWLQALDRLSDQWPCHLGL